MKLKPVYFLNVLCAALAVFLLAQGINEIPLLVWDEAIYSTNAIEMMHNNQYAVHWFKGEVDWYNMKPVFFTWLRILSFKLFGYELWVHRLPSLLFACASAFLVYRFVFRFTQSRYWSVFALFLLVTAPGFNTLHVVKGGEFDSALAFFSSAFVLQSFVAIQTEKKRDLCWASVFLLLAFFTKSIAGLFFVPSVLFYIVWKKKDWFYKLKYYRYPVLILLGIVSYFACLEILYPGYWQNLYAHQFQRFALSQNDIVLPWYYYFKSPSVIPYYALPFIIILGLKLGQKAISPIVLYLLICVMGYLLLLSLSSTKHGFYSAPIFPISSVLLALCFKAMFTKWFNRSLLWPVILAVIMILPLHFTFAKGQFYQRYYNRSFPLFYVKQLLAGNMSMGEREEEPRLGTDARCFFGEAQNWFKPYDSIAIWSHNPFIPNTEHYNSHLAFYTQYWRYVEHCDVKFIQESGENVALLLIRKKDYNPLHWVGYEVFKESENMLLIQK